MNVQVMTDTFLINNLYATVLSDSNVDKSFIAPKFKHMDSIQEETCRVETTNEPSEIYLRNLNKLCLST